MYIVCMYLCVNNHMLSVAIFCLKVTRFLLGLLVFAVG